MIQHAKNKLYYAGGGNWVPDLGRARQFASPMDAFVYAFQHEFNQARVVVFPLNRPAVLIPV